MNENRSGRKVGKTYRTTQLFYGSEKSCQICTDFVGVCLLKLMLRFRCLRLLLALERRICVFRIGFESLLVIEPCCKA